MIEDWRLSDTVSTVLGPVIILSGLAGAAAGVPEAVPTALSLSGPKSALLEAGRKLLTYVAEKEKGGPFDCYQRMNAAYCLLTYTAFFDAVDRAFPSIHGAFRNKKPAED